MFHSYLGKFEYFTNLVILRPSYWGPMIPEATLWGSLGAPSQKNPWIPPFEGENLGMDDFPDKPSTREAVMPKTNNKKNENASKNLWNGPLQLQTPSETVFGPASSPFSDPGSSSRCLFWPRVTVEFLPERIERLMKQKCFKSDTVKSIKKKSDWGRVINIHYFYLFLVKKNKWAYQK